MANSSTKLFNLYIDASPLAEDRISGIPHFTAELIRGLDNHPDNGKLFRVFLLISYDKKKKLSRWKYKNINIKVLPIPLRIFNLIWKYNMLPPLDLFLGRGVYLFPNYKNWPLLKSISLTYIHDLGFIRYPEFVQPKNLEFLSNNINKWILRSDLVLTGSQHAKKEIETLLGVPSAKVVSIYHGVNHEEYYPRPISDIKKAKKANGITGKYLIYIGSLEPRKNLIRMIEAYEMLPKNINNKYALCIVGGGGWLNDEILESIKNAQLNGFKIFQPKKYVTDSDLPGIISGAELLLHPAIYEGFGLSPLQAMACGTPVVVANNSSLPEVVGRAGLLVDAENVEDISAKIERVLEDNKYRSSLIAEGLKQAAKFDWNKSARQLITCIKKVSNDD